MRTCQSETELNHSAKEINMEASIVFSCKNWIDSIRRDHTRASDGSWSNDGSICQIEYKKHNMPKK